MPSLSRICPAAIIFLLFLPSAANSATTVGVTYNPSSPNLPPPEHVASTLQSLRISAVRMLDPTPAAVRAFAYTNITLLLTVPNYIVSSFAANRSGTDLWLYTYVLPYHPRTRISMISVGNDVITAGEGAGSRDPSTFLLPALRNLRDSLRNYSIRTISVSTTFSFVNIMTSSFPPSAAEYQEPIGSLIIRPLLRFLAESNSSFLVNLYPYSIYRLNSEIPLGYLLFQEHPLNFRDDVVTGVRYRNLFDMMADAVIAAMAVAGQENVSVIVTETGWPSESEVQASGNYAEMYLKGLVKHLKSGTGTPLRKEGLSEAYIYELFDDPNTTAVSASGRTADYHWGIMYPNMTMKYNVNFSGAIRVLVSGFALDLAGMMMILASVMMLFGILG